MTNPGGIAGAMDYVPATERPAMACIVCGVAIDGNTKGNFHARAAPGGIIHACSDACAARPPFRLWTPAEVAMLNARQQDGRLHPYTCPGDEACTAQDNRNLFATTHGWVCACGLYTQAWAHEGAEG